MKKRVFSAAVILLLLLSISVCAFATTTYPAPKPVEVGQSLDHLLATVSAESEVSAVDGTLPAGVSLEVVLRDAEQDIYLRGVPAVVGNYNCVIKVSGSGDLMCNVEVTPPVPNVQTGGSVVCSVNDTVSVSVFASVSDGGSLSYQWYQSSTNSTAGATAIMGETGDSLQVDTSAVGTMYYYCVVTNTSGGISVSATSGVIPVTVGELTLESVSVKTPPEKTVYTVGDKLDTAGLTLEVHYHNGSSAVVSEGFTVYPTRLSTAGEQAVEVEYKGKTCSFSVNVEQPEEKIDGIGVLTLPAKTSYAVGEQLDFSGLSIRVYTNNGHRDVYTGLECSPSSFDRPGSHAVTVSYGGKTCTFNVLVKAEVRPVSLSVNTLPAKTEYTVGDTLDVSGLSLRETDNTNGSREITEGFDYMPKTLDKAGKQEITVTYGGLSCRFTVSVTEKAAEAPSQAPQASASPAPAEPIVEAPAVHKGRDAKTVMSIILTIAVIALAGSLVYMIIVRRREDMMEKNSPDKGNHDNDELNFFDNFRKK